MRQYTGLIFVFLLTPQYMTGDRGPLEPEIKDIFNPIMPELPELVLPERIPTLTELLNVECMDDATANLDNRRSFKLGDLFGLNWPTEEQFTPGEEFMDYITTHWREGTMPEVRFSLREGAIRNVPGEHFDAAIVAGRTKRLVLITGNPQSGKTKTLQNVGQYLEKYDSPSKPVITVDLSTLAVPDNVQPITLKDVISASKMDPLYRGLFENIVERNPSATTMLLDGIDRVPKASDRVMNLITDLHSKNVKLIMTANRDINSRLSSHQMTSADVIEIPPEISTLTTNELLMKNLLSSAKSDIADNFQAKKDYRRTLQIVLDEVPLPRDFPVVNKILQHIRNDILNPFPNVDGFLEVYDKFTTAHETLKQSDHVKFDKFKFYNEFLESWNADSNFYGPQALNQIFELGPESVQTEIQSHLQSSNAMLGVRGEESFKFLTYQNGAPNEFVHREYQRYFASKYIADSFSKESPLTNSFETVMRDPQYKFVLEFLNGAVRDPQYSETIGNKLKTLAASNTEFVHQTLDNLIELRMDNLCSEMLKGMGVDQVKTYLEQPEITLKSKAKYSLGMLADPTTTTRADYIPRKSDLQYTGSRASMVINSEMTESSKAWKSLGYIEDPSVSIDYHAKKGITELNSFLEKYPGHKFPVESLNKAMFESMKSLGERSIEVMNKLWELGARPHDFQIDGQSLAHVAAEKSNKALLRTVHENYHVPLTSGRVIGEKFGQSVLATALDSNPFPSKSRRGFWPMMEYLAEKLPLSQYANALNEYQPKIADISEHNSIFEATIAGSVFEDVDVADLFKRLIPVDELDIPREVASVRRNTVIKHSQDVANLESNSRRIILKGRSDYVTVTDVVLQHRGTDSLTAIDKSAYKNTIKILINREGKTFTERQASRAYELIVRNEPQSELKEMRQFIQENVIKTLSSDISFEHSLKFSETLLLRENNRLDRFNSRPAVTDGISKSVLTTIYDEDLASSWKSGSTRMDVIDDSSDWDSDSSEEYCMI